MDFGMPVLIELSSLRENVELCRELGLSFIEMNMNMPDYQLQELDANELSGYMKANGIYFTLHTADDMNMADFNPLVARAHTDTVVAVIGLAKKIGLPIINMHLNNGTYVTLPDERVFLFNKHVDKYMERISSFRKACELAADGADISICIENMEGHQVFAKTAIDYLMESDLFCLTMDTGHSYCANGVDQPIYDKYPHKLRHMHLHDACGKNPHLALGTGDINLKAQLKIASKNKCRVVIETKTVASLRASVSYLKENGF